MNANDLYDWKRHPVTQAVFSELHGRIQLMTAYLIENEGDDPDKVARTRGAILAHRDLLNIEFPDIEEPQEQ